MGGRGWGGVDCRDEGKRGSEGDGVIGMQPDASAETGPDTSWKGSARDAVSA